MGDTVIFLSAYKTTTFTRSKKLFPRKEDLLDLLKKHHITYNLLFKDESSKTWKNVNHDLDQIAVEFKQFLNNEGFGW